MKYKLLSIMLALALLFLCALPTGAVETEETDVLPETVEINNTEDFLEFAQNCVLDTWSQNKQVVLKADISLLGTGFLSIPTFGGSFDGNGHTIRGLSLKQSVNPAGLFSYLQPTAVVQNLNVEGTVKPHGDAAIVGGIAGHNDGTIENCSFSGEVEGNSNTGGIAGINYGTIRGCKTAGILLGDHMTGGITGRNEGIAEKCENYMEINTVSVDPTIDPTQIDLDLTMDISKLSSIDTSTAATDTGGIAGYSSGMVVNCSNDATVGYPSIGYNLGGIVGRNCGYVENCRNNGSVRGRKDVGGIVGQIEPDVALILSPDYLETLSDQFEQLGNLVSSAGSHSASAGGEIQSCIQKIAAYESSARSALDSLASGLHDGLTDGQFGLGTPNADAVSALSSSIQGMVNATNELKKTVADSVDDLGADADAISGQIGSIARTFALATEDSGEDTISDASDGDIADIQEGKVLNSVNSAVVEADMNSGGIVGIMGLEYTLDPEDDTFGGKATQRRRYELKAIVQDCVNTGAVTSKRSYSGGICGRMELGLITSSENYGPVSSENGDYVGGIAGITGGTVRNCYVKCTLKGQKYIGGIVGNGVVQDLTGDSSTVTGCYSMVKITDYDQYIGAVSGADSGNYAGNYFVSDTLAGINRVSYSALAEPVSYDTLLRMDDLPQPFHSLTLSFMAEGETLKSISFDFGTSFDYSIYPEIPEKEGHYARWDITDLKNLHYDTVVTAQYFPHITSLNSTDVRPDGNSILFVQGLFQEGDSLAVVPGMTELPTGLKQKALEHWTVNIPSDGLESHRIRYLPTEDIQIYVLKNGTWNQANAEKMGTYFVFDALGTEVEFAVIQKESNWMTVIETAAAVLILVLLFVLLAIRIGKNQKIAGSPVTVKQKQRYFLAVVLLLAAGAMAVTLYYLPQTTAADTLRAFNILKSYTEQSAHTMELNVKAKFSDRELDVTAEIDTAAVGETPVTRISESGRTLYFANGVVFLENGTSYRLNSDAPDYSLILPQLLDVYELVDVKAVNGVYSITAENSQAAELLNLLMPAAKSLLSDGNSLTVDLVTESDTLTEIHFTGAGNLTDSVKTPFSISAVLKILPASEIEIPSAIGQALENHSYQPQEIYSDDLVRLVNAWKHFNTQNPVGATVVAAANCGPITLSEDFLLYQWKIENTVMRGIEKGGDTFYIADGTVCNAEGKVVKPGSAGTIDVPKLLDLVYQNFQNVTFHCVQTDTGHLYTVALDQSGMKELMATLVPSSASMDIIYGDGCIQLIIEEDMLRSLTLTCSGTIMSTDVSASIEMQLIDGHIAAELPDAVKEIFENIEE